MHEILQKASVPKHITVLHTAVECHGEIAVAMALVCLLGLRVADVCVIDNQER